MSGPSTSPGEMSGFSLHHGPASELDDSVLDMLLTGQPLPPDAPLLARMTANALASLGDPQRPGALAGEAAARAAFAQTAASSATWSCARRARPRRRSVRVRPRLAAVLAAAAISLGGTVTAAYAGALPAPIQDLAHLAVGAPAPHHAAQHPHSHPQPHPRPQPRASQLCAAYQHAQARGGPAPAAQARKLARAAGGAGKIDGYCASLGVPGASSAHHGALGRSAKAHPGHAKARGKPDAHRRNPHAPRKAGTEPKAHSHQAQAKAHA